MEEGWFPVLLQWSLRDKERLPELLSRFAASFKRWNYVWRRSNGRKT